MKKYEIPTLTTTRMLMNPIFAQTGAALTAIPECSTACCHGGEQFAVAFLCAEGNAQTIDLDEFTAEVIINCVDEQTQEVVGSETINFQLSGCEVVSDSEDTSCPNGTFLISCDEAVSCASLSLCTGGGQDPSDDSPLVTISHPQLGEFTCDPEVAS